MNKQFEGRAALVTGAASGIGEATARMLADRGADLILFDKDSERGSAVCASLNTAGHAAIFVAGDVSVSGNCSEAVKVAIERYGKLDVLVNNAGGGKLVSALELSDEEWHWMQGINVDGTFFFSRAALPHMLAAGGGAIVNVASVHGLVGFKDHAGYSAAKGAIVNLTRTFGAQYADRGVRVNAVCPGVIRTPLVERGCDDAAMRMLVAMHPIGRLGQANEVAAAICFLGSDEASFITGAVLPVDGGYTAV